jgi:hypothetical protein
MADASSINSRKNEPARGGESTAVSRLLLTVSEVELLLLLVLLVVTVVEMLMLLMLLTAIELDEETDDAAEQDDDDSTIGSRSICDETADRVDLFKKDASIVRPKRTVTVRKEAKIVKKDGKLKRFDNFKNVKREFGSIKAIESQMTKKLNFKLVKVSE